MSDVIPAFKIGGTHALVVCLYVFVVFSALHLLALRFPESKFAKVMFALNW